MSSGNKRMIKVNKEVTGMRIAIDLDGTLTTEGGVGDYMNMTPNEVIKVLDKMIPREEVIEAVNGLYQSNIICIYTARSDVFTNVSKKWLKRNGVKYHYLTMNKEYYDLFVDDKGMTPETFLRKMK